jgi:hypothetical protein
MSTIPANPASVDKNADSDGIANSGERGTRGGRMATPYGSTAHARHHATVSD